MVRPGRDDERVDVGLKIAPRGEEPPGHGADHAFVDVDLPRGIPTGAAARQGEQRACSDAVVDRLAGDAENLSQFAGAVPLPDVRRGEPGWQSRRLDADLERGLLAAFKRGAELLARRSPAGLVLRPTGHDEVVAKKPDDGQPTVTASAPLGELVLFTYGRQANAEVELDGPAEAVAAVRTAPFGI